MTSDEQCWVRQKSGGTVLLLFVAESHEATICPKQEGGYQHQQLTRKADKIHDGKGGL